MSYLFYAWWDCRFVGLLLLSTLVDYFVGQKLYAAKRDRAATTLAHGIHVFKPRILAFFKYSGFFC